jgi:NAD(P)H-nitrite reductase large subunit
MRYLIVGNSAAGNAAAESIRRHDQSGEVLILSAESEASYYKPLLPYVIEDAPEGGNLFRDAIHTPPDVAVHSGIRVRAVMPEDKAVILEDGTRVNYDRLLLATGASPIRPEIECLAGSGVHVLRTLEDALAIRAAAKTASAVAIIGGGRIGTKTAVALRHLGLEVTIIETLSRIIPQQLDLESSRILEQRLNAVRITMVFQKTAVKILRDWRFAVEGVLLDDSTIVPADFVVLSAGVRPNTGIARKTGITVRKGILVDQRLETGVPDIFAAGDVVETNDIVTGEPIVSALWTNAVAMGHIAGENMTGGQREYYGAFNMMNALDIDGLAIISGGIIFPDAEYSDQVHAMVKKGSYRKTIFRNNRLVGFTMVGDIERAGILTALMREHKDISRVKSAIIDGTLSYAETL